jgi:hypothetical protein
MMLRRGKVLLRGLESVRAAYDEVLSAQAAVEDIPAPHFEHAFVLMEQEAAAIMGTSIVRGDYATRPLA